MAYDEMNRMDDDIAQCKVVYFPQVRCRFSSINYMTSYDDDFDNDTVVVA